jgi:hypothetical protein
MFIAALRARRIRSGFDRRAEKEPTTEQYWSGHPYLLGPHQAMKFNVRPIEIKHWFQMRTVGSSKVNPNYLSIDLRNRLQRAPIKFVFSVQLEKDLQPHP